MADFNMGKLRPQVDIDIGLTLTDIDELLNEKHLLLKGGESNIFISVVKKNLNEGKRQTDSTWIR